MSKKKLVIFYLGFKDMVMCINGICCSVDKNNAGCLTICREQTCESAEKYFMESILSIFYLQIFVRKQIAQLFSIYIQLYNFLAQNITTKGAHKMLMKLTHGCLKKTLAGLFAPPDVLCPPLK